MYEVFCIAGDGSHFGGCFHSEEWQAVQAVLDLVNEGYTAGMQWVSHKQDMLDMWNE